MVAMIIRKGIMHIIIKSITALLTILLISSTVSAAKKSTPPVRQQPSAVSTPLQQTLASKTYQRELQKAQRDQAQLAWQMGQIIQLDPKFFTTSFPQTRNDLAYRMWNTQQRPFPIQLKNLDYICSFNALTQVLWRLTPLNLALVRSKERTPLIDKYGLIDAYLKSIATKNAALRTPDALMDVKNLIDILNAIHQEKLKKIGDETKKKQLADPFEIWQYFTEQCPDDVKELFSVWTHDTVYCPIGKGHDKTTHNEPYPYVSIRVISKKSNNLQDMLDRQIQEETIEEVSAQCKRCNQLKLKASKVFAQPPAILVIHTGRSTGKRHDGKTPLLQDPVTFPLEKLTFGGQNYDLFGVVFHSGETAEGGHYYSWVRQRDNLWYCCNDDKITETRNPAKIQSHNETFIFFYLRKKDDNAP